MVKHRGYLLPIPHVAFCYVIHFLHLALADVFYAIARAFRLAELRGLLGKHLERAEGSLGKTRTICNGV